jgi:hypothetical protein
VKDSSKIVFETATSTLTINSRFVRSALPLALRCESCDVWYQLPVGWPVGRDLREAGKEYEVYVLPCGHRLDSENYSVGVTWVDGPDAEHETYERERATRSMRRSCPHRCRRQPGPVTAPSRRPAAFFAAVSERMRKLASVTPRSRSNSETDCPSDQPPTPPTQLVGVRPALEVLNCIADPT